MIRECMGTNVQYEYYDRCSPISYIIILHNVNTILYTKRGR